MNHVLSGRESKADQMGFEARDDYLRVLDELPALMWRAGLDGKVNYFNRGWLAFTGHTFEHEVGDGWLAGVHPDDIDRSNQQYFAAFARREPFEMEYRLMHHSGEYRWILDIGRPIFNTQGEFAGYIGTCFDLTERKQMEQALREANQAMEQSNRALRQSETMFKALFEQAPDALVGVDQQGKVVLVNEQAKKMFGYSWDELVGKPVELLMPGSFQDRHQAHVARMMQNPTRRPMGVGLVLTAQRKNGSTFPVDINLGPLNTESGPVVLATIRDTTDRKEAEAAIRDREKLLTTAAAAAPVVFFKMALDGTIVLSLGQSLARRLDNIDTVGRSLYDVYGKYPQVIDAFHRALQGDTLTTVVEANGLVYEATYAPLHDENGAIIAVVGVAIDVTRHRQVEEALRKSEAHFRTIFNDTVLGIKVVDLQGRIVESNPALQQMTGYSAEELHMMTFVDLTHPEDTPVMRQLMDDLTTGKTDHFYVEKRYLRKDGQVLWGTLAMSLFRGPDSEPQYGIGMIENITSQKQVEVELAEQQRRMADGIEIERLQLAQELHDGPLQELQAMSYQVAFLEALVSDREGQAEITALQDEIKKISQSLRSICGELRPPALTPFGLERAIRSHAEHFHEQHPEIKLHLRLTNDGKVLPERVRLALFRIYQHSMANILRHSEAKNVNITFDFDDDRIELRIEDDGKGFRVPRRWIELVREGHFGLVGSIERAESVGGKLDISSNPGEGSRIRVTVPRREEDQVTLKEQRYKLGLSFQ